MVLTLATQALWRVASSTRSASRSPRRRGVTRWSQARASRAARMASRASLLAPCGAAAAWAAQSRPPARRGPAGRRPAQHRCYRRPPPPNSAVPAPVSGRTRAGVGSRQVGRRRGLRQGPADPIGRCGGEAVAVGVHPDHPIHGVGQPGHRDRAPFRWTSGRVGLEGATPRRFCDGSQPHRVGQAAHQASKRRARSTPAPRQAARNQGNSYGRLNRCESCRGARRRLPWRVVAVAGGSGLSAGLAAAGPPLALGLGRARRAGGGQPAGSATTTRTPTKGGLSHRRQRQEQTTTRAAARTRE